MYNGSSLQHRLEDIVLSNYTLIELSFHGNGEHFAHWLKIGGAEFQEPFFIFTVNRIKERLQRRALLTTRIEALLRRGAARRGIYPACFIYHVSRCGSTALVNMLKATSRHFVLSEIPLPVVAMLRTPELCTHDQWRDVTRATLATLGGIAPRNATHFFVKGFHGHTLAIPLIREAMPGVPEVFMYRDPIEVTMSLVESPPAQGWLWEEYMTGLPMSAAVERPMTELAARAVGRILSAMHTYARENTLLLNYNQLSDITPETVLTHCGIAHNAKMVKGMVATLKFDAKNPQREFVADADRRQREATASVRDAVDRHAMAAYLKLEMLRRSRESAGEACYGSSRP